MERYEFPRHVPMEAQPAWITDTLEEEKDMGEDLFDKLMTQLAGVIDTVEELKKEANNKQPQNTEELNTLRMMLETEKERANAAESKLKVVVEALKNA